MKKNRLISVAVLASITAGTMYAINRSINLLANAKASLTNTHAQKYEWRFGDIFYTLQGQGKPILLVHELTCGSSDLEWKKIVNSYAETHTVYTIDLLGCGRSDKPALTYTNYLYVQMISDFVKNVIKHRVDIVCTGTSSQFVVMACFNDNTLFDKIAMINPESIVINSQKISTNKRLTKLLIEMPIIGTTIFNIKNSYANYRKIFHQKYFSASNSINRTLIKNYYDAAHYGTMTSKYFFASIEANYTEINIAHAIKEIDNSIIIIAGAEESCINETIAEYKAFNPSVESVVIQGCKHLPQLEKPKDFVKELSIFLG